MKKTALFLIAMIFASGLMAQQLGQAELAELKSSFNNDAFAKSIHNIIVSNKGIKEGEKFAPATVCHQSETSLRQQIFHLSLIASCSLGHFLHIIKCEGAGEDDDGKFPIFVSHHDNG